MGQDGPNYKAHMIAMDTHIKEKMDAEKSTCRKNPSKPKPAANQSKAGKLPQQEELRMVPSPWT